MPGAHGEPGSTTLASLGQPLGSHEPWMVHATYLSSERSVHLRKWTDPARCTRLRRAHPRQDLYLGMGADPRAKFPNPRAHPCSKLTEGRNIMFWVNWGAEGSTRAQKLIRVADTGAIITRALVPIRHLYLAALFSADTLATLVVAASQHAQEVRAEITEAFSHWGVVAWPDDPAQYWTHEADPVDEPVVSPEISDAFLGPDWPSPLIGADFQWPAGEEPVAEECPDWGHEVDLEPSEGNDAEEEAPANPATAPLT